MNDEKIYYMVYRVYNNKERPGSKENSVAYGWTSDKNVLKAFFKQRDEKKYLVIKMRKVQIEEILNNYNHDATGEYMIDYLPLKSAKTGEEFRLFMTVNEMQECERNVQKIFEDLSSIDKIDKDNISKYVSMIINLDQSYYDALFYIGYRPKEIAAMFDDCNDENIYQQIGNAYEGMPCEEYYSNGHLNQVPGLSALEDVSNKILYSVESFVKVLRKDM
jgi:hypothetical protein